MTILLSDPRVGAIPVRESGEPLVALGPGLGPALARVRESLAVRLHRAAALLPAGVGLRVVEGHRSEADQRLIIARYAGEVAAAHPGVDAVELEILTSRFVAPIAVAPHVAGAAVDLTLVDADGVELDLGTPIDATPEESDDACYFAATGIPAAARAHRDLLAEVLGAVGLVNYPTEWWHWSYGDRYWALMTGAPAALYGPVADREAVA
ncbi:dipeptidase [Nocardioides silvaticus]|uniref:Dipeptidase n=1 Tax=Nocardioides silvaticus TaxID=2201891 RepID=A0A316TD00_9ACTN|nr:M15 family metallopeptidase [Nocardioides silvaticus]PWN00899.1 dipeptidase [Nocardioides silvaticus]